MLKILKARALFALLCLAPTAVFAVSGWTDTVPVVELTPTTQLRYLVKLKVSSNPSGCKNKDTFYQDYSAFGSDKMFLVLLEAVSSRKNVRVYVTGKCELNGYSEISSISIAP